MACLGVTVDNGSTTHVKTQGIWSGDYTSRSAVELKLCNVNKQMESKLARKQRFFEAYQARLKKPTLKWQKALGRLGLGQASDKAKPQAPKKKRVPKKRRPLTGQRKLDRAQQSRESTARAREKKRIAEGRVKKKAGRPALGFGPVSDKPKAPSMLAEYGGKRHDQDVNWGRQKTGKAADKRKKQASSRAERAARRAEPIKRTEKEWKRLMKGRRSEEEWKNLGFRPSQISEEALRLEQEEEKREIVDDLEELEFEEIAQPGVIKLFRWLRPGIVKQDMAKQWLLGKTKLRPRWTQGFGDELSLKGGRLMVSGLPVMSDAELRKHIKKTYYTPSLPITVEGVFDHLRERIANASRKQVHKVLNSLQTYQLLKPRRKPMVNTQTTMVYQPGRIGQDTFFPSKKYWNGRVYPVTVLADQWSGYTKAFLMGTEEAHYSYYALKLFIQELQSEFGVRVNQLLTDKGSEMAYDKQLEIDFPRIRHMQSPTGNAVPFIEAKVKLIQSRLWVARTAYDGKVLTIADILDDTIADINSTKRPTRGNLTPTQLLKITPNMRGFINQKQRNSVKMVSNRIHGLPDIFKGDTVRLTIYTRKQQEAYGIPLKDKDKKVTTTLKWFRPKWSTKIHTVIGGRAVANGRLKYRVSGSPQGWWRWEMLKINPDIDKEVPAFDAGSRAQVITKAQVN